MTAVTYRLPLPPQGSGSNARGRWAKSRAASQYRSECADAYREHGVPEGAPWELSHVTVEMRVCRRKPRIKNTMTVQERNDYEAFKAAVRPLDAGNVLDACKAAIDALQPESWRKVKDRSVIVPGAGVVVADDAKHMTLGAPSLVEVGSFADEGVWVTVEARDA
jgi:hypothetical protein